MFPYRAIPDLVPGALAAPLAHITSGDIVPLLLLVLVAARIGVLWAQSVSNLGAKHR